MKEDKFEELLEMEDDLSLKEVNKKIKRQMHKQIYSRVILILLALFVGWQGIYHGTSFLCERFNYDPMNENSIVADPDSSVYPQGFHVLMGTFVNMYDPGKQYVGSYYTKLGFGRYEVTAKLYNLFEPLSIDGADNMEINIHRSSLSGMNTDYTINLYKYYDENADETYLKNLEEKYDFSIEDIQELPNSAIIDVSLSFQKTYTLDETLLFINQYQDSDFIWLANHIKGEIAEGIALYDIYYNELANKEDYPNFYLEKEPLMNDISKKKYASQSLTSDIIQQRYLSQLKLLLDHEDFVQLLTTYYGGMITYESLQERYEEALNHEIPVIGVRGYVKKQDLLDMFENNELKYVYVHDVKLSSLQK